MLIAIFNNIGLASIIGYSLLAVGLVATALSSQRYLLLYTLAGMAYWALIEGLQSGLTHMFALSGWNGYVVAMLISWVPLAGWVIYRSISAPQRRKRAQEQAKAKYIEHTPVYKDYEPKYQ